MTKVSKHPHMPISVPLVGRAAQPKISASSRILCPPIFPAKREMKEGEWEAREEDGEKGGQPHMCQGVCARPQKVHVHTRIYTHTRTAAAITVATADPSAVWYEK